MTERDYRIAHPTISAPRATPNTLMITNARGLQFCVRMVFQGDSYGLNNCLTNEQPDALVEFYDTRYPHCEFGQFASSYYASTLLDGSLLQRGLCLDGGVSDWNLDAEATRQALEWVQTKCAEVPGCLKAPDHGTFVLTF